MQLQPDLWIEGPYHVDFSPRGELRIVGRGNHLYLGLAGIPKSEIEIGKVARREDRLRIRGEFKQARLKLLDPVVCSVSQVRSLTERPGRHRDFAALISNEYSKVAPNEIQFEVYRGQPSIRYRRSYGDQWYGARLILSKGVTVTRLGDESAFILEGNGPIQFEIIAEATFPHPPRSRRVIKSREVIDLGRFRDWADFIQHLLDRTALEITHLVTNEKTSGFEYGTIFPRDWMESADLGVGDLAPRAIDYMYERALQFVSPEGVGWHETLIGEAEFERQLRRSTIVDSLKEATPVSLQRSVDLVAERKESLVARQMIDIEPRYLMGMNQVSPRFWRNQEAVEKLKRVAGYVLEQARTKSVITFREKPMEVRRHRDDRYFEVGNWRDSTGAYDGAKQPIAPYDVNVVFYPAALRAIQKYQKRLGMEVADLPELLEKWQGVESYFRFLNPDGKPAYALALSEAIIRNGRPVINRLEVNHTDEAYLLAYGEPDRAVVRSFAERLLDERYFYTQSGPTIIGRSESSYSTRDYHGQVIWTKQTAFCSLGLSRSLSRARKERWSEKDQELLSQAIQAIYSTSLRAFAELGGIPELHYDRNGSPHFYDDQSEAEGQMSKVQLWSAVGARRILRDYHSLVGSL